MYRTLCNLNIAHADEDETEFFATVGDGGSIRVWGLKTGVCVKSSEKGALSGQFTELTLLPESSRLVTVNSNQVWYRRRYFIVILC